MNPDLHSFWRLIYLLAGEPHYLVAVEIFAAVCGLLGSLLLALKGKSAPWGWLFFMLSNIGWLTFSYGFSHWFLLVQQIGFSITSAIGIWKWLIQPQFDAPAQPRRSMVAPRFLLKLRDRVLALLFLLVMSILLFIAGAIDGLVGAWREFRDLRFEQDLRRSRRNAP